jgi:hypothetical protein
MYMSTTSWLIDAPGTLIIWLFTSVHHAATLFQDTKVIRSGRRRDDARVNLWSGRHDRAAPAKGILIGLALSMLFWAAMFALRCF